MKAWQRDLNSIGFWIALIAGTIMFGLGHQSWCDRGIYALLIAVIFKVQSQEENNGKGTSDHDSSSD